MPPLLIAVDLLQPSPPIESSLHLMPFPLAHIRHRSMDLANHPGLGPLRMTARGQETTSAVTFASVAVRMNATWNGSFLATLLATEEGPVHGDPLLPDIWTFHASHLRHPRSNSLPKGHPHQSEWDSLLTQGLAHPGDPFLGILVLQGHAPPGIPSLQREVTLLLKEDVMSRRDSVSPQQHHSSRASSLEPSSRETPFTVFSYPSFFSFEGRQRS